MRHAVFHLVVDAKGQTLHFRHIAVALFRWHDLADLSKVQEHGGLALGTKLADFGQPGIDRFLCVGARVQSGLQLLFLGVYACAIIAAYDPVTVMQPTDTIHLGVIEFVFHAEPRKVIGGLGHVPHPPMCGDALSREKQCGCRQKHCHKNEQRSAHGLANGVGGHGVEIPRLGLFPDVACAGGHAGESTNHQHERETSKGEARHQKSLDPTLQPIR